jgi:NAD(P)-dependent dehydrogenase (short-subunit alcohol dehydrogenase family)
LASKNVRVNCVNPGTCHFFKWRIYNISYLGVTVTNLHKRGGMDEATYAKFLEHSKTTHAMGRPGNF